MIAFPILLIKRVYPLVVHAGVKAIAAGSFHSMVIKTDGSVWAAGNNEKGQLGDGDGSKIHRPSFVKVVSPGQCDVMM